MKEGRKEGGKEEESIDGKFSSSLWVFFFFMTIRLMRVVPKPNERRERKNEE